ncbi:MAG TPA: agmatinase [Thermoanaerobaculaceae bacterium]|nr:agmatinase [Thermoanaerobaculaceae bacterium]HRS16919.1 agmatinase [Thermoanaerobaculaceae bacterium]
MSDDCYPAYLSFLGLPEDANPQERARVAVLPIPYDHTTSYQAGARRGPLAILEASAYVETYDEELDRDVVGELGIVTLPPIAPEAAGPQAMQARIARVAAEVWRQNRFVVALGGEHSVSPPLVEAARSRHPGLGVLQLDAHADLRSAYEGTLANHACAMYPLVQAGVPLAQVGIRSLTAEERQLQRERNVCCVFAAEAVGRPVDEWIDRVLDALPEQVYVTIDLDALDPSIMPATGTPEPGGLDWYRALAVLRAVALRKRIVACDVVELAPQPGNVAPDFLAARLAYKLIGYRFFLGPGAGSD